MQNILFEIIDDIAWLTLNRPQQHNAFNAQTIQEIREAVALISNGDAKCRALVVQAEGRSFCAGADLNWMRDTAKQPEQQNYDDALNLANMLSELYYCPVPTIAAIAGNAFGGGVGLAACCDIVIASKNANFSLSEVKLGLIPATISPYVLKAIGERHAKRFFITAERFDAQHGHAIGLVHALVETSDDVAAAVDRQLALMAANGPVAMQKAKQLAQHESDLAITTTQQERLAQLIADVRASSEGQEGLNAFLEKRPAAFVQTSTRGNTHD